MYQLPDKHTWIAENIVSNSVIDKPRRPNLKNIQFQKVVRKTRLTLVMMGCWGVYFAPYNIARLSALTKEAGYGTKSFDFNIELYRDLNAIGVEAWASNNCFWWLDQEEYYDKLHEQSLPFLELYLKQIVESAPDVLGFSVYDTNIVPTTWMIKEIKKLLPTVKIILGGPSCHSSTFEPIPEVDHWVAGEGEQVLLDFLEDIENQVPVIERKLGSTYGNVRVDLDSLPFPDYSDFDLDKYTNGTGISSEISRGCVAKCTFCTETWFWKYRDRQSHSILDEIEFQVKNYGINFVWFIDSLVNGNLKELRKFAIGIQQRKINLSWMGYARCDERMDLSYFKDLAASGCNHLSFGVESGSQKVLDIMKKNITVEGVHNNLRDCKLARIQTHVNWIVGYVGEDHEAFAHSLNLLWNTRNHIDIISTGMTLGIKEGSGSVLDTQRETFNVSGPTTNFCGWWYSLDWTNTKLHRLIRLRLTNIWLKVCSSNGTIINSQDRATVYTLNYSKDNLVDFLEYEQFDYHIIDTRMENFGDTVVNEVWAFLRLMYRAVGAFEFELDFSRDLDIAEFGEWLIAPDFTASYQFRIDKDGNWTAKFDNQFVCADPYYRGTSKDFEFDWTGTGQWSRDIKPFPRKVTYALTPQ
jgi:hypothetical protein